MSSFIDDMKVELFGFPHERHTRFKFALDQREVVGSETKFTFSINWVAHAYIDDRDSAEEKRLVREMLVKHVREEIYGEFRQALMRAERGTYERDDDMLKEALTEIRNLIEG